MRAKVWGAGLVALALCLAGSHACSCNGIINSEGQGECQTTYRGKQWCYTNKGKCKDEKKGSSSERFWSYEACKNYHANGLECYGLNGDRCTFPFKWDGRIFSNCTTYKSENGAAWCATRVWKNDREAVPGSLQDCSAPCDFGASPYEECPRSPVIKGRSRHCCTPDQPCGIGEGDCDIDDDCGDGLKCGNSNCAEFRPDNYAQADCCYNPKVSDICKHPRGRAHSECGIKTSDPVYTLNKGGHIKCNLDSDCPPTVEEASFGKPLSFLTAVTGIGSLSPKSLAQNSPSCPSAHCKRPSLANPGRLICCLLIRAPWGNGRIAICPNSCD